MQKNQPTFAALAVALALTLGAGSALAQESLRIDGQNHAGALTAETPKRSDNRHYVIYQLQGRPNQRVRVNLTSSDFDTFLFADEQVSVECSSCQSNDDGGDGTNSRLVLTLPASGRMQVMATSYGGDSTGTFQISATELPQAQPLSSSTRPLPTGQRQTATLDESSAVESNRNSPAQLWQLRGRPGQTLTVRMNSENLDSWLAYGTVQNNTFTVESSDDDGAGSGLNARLRVPLDNRGQALVMATSYGSDASGSYTIIAEEPPVQRPVTVNTLRVGESTRALLDDSNPFEPETEIRYQVYRIQGNPGQRLVVRMESADFDPILRWGVYQGEDFVEDARDDDGGGGTSAQMTITLDAEGAGRLIATAYENFDNKGEGAYTLSIVNAPAASGSNSSNGNSNNDRN